MATSTASLTEPSASCAGTTSGSSCTSSCPRSSARIWSRTSCATGAVLPLAQRAVHPGRVLGRRLPVRPQPGAARLHRELLRRRGAPSSPPVPRGHRSQPPRPRRPRRRQTRPPPLRRLAHLLRSRAHPARSRGPWGSPKPNKRIDSKLSSILFDLPGLADAPRSLAQRNLLRALTFELPSGQRVARAMNLSRLKREELADLRPLGFDEDTPLWLYILREAEILADGRRLGPSAGGSSPRSCSDSCKATTAPTCDKIRAGGPRSAAMDASR